MNENGQPKPDDVMLFVELRADGKLKVQSPLPPKEVAKALQGLAIEMLYQDMERMTSPHIIRPTIEQLTKVSH